MPQLMANHRKRIVETRMEHFYSLMNQAVLMSENDYGMFDDWTFPPDAYNADEMETYYNKYFRPYVKTIRTEKKNGMLYVYLADSSMFKVFNHNPSSKLLHLYFYPMGRERNNVMGQDNFTFLIWTGNKGNKVEPYKFGWGGTREQLLSTGTYACKNHSHYCAALIQYDNWKIPDDYPFRF